MQSRRLFSFTAWAHRWAHIRCMMLRTSILVVFDLVTSLCSIIFYAVQYSQYVCLWQIICMCLPWLVVNFVPWAIACRWWCWRQRSSPLLQCLAALRYTATFYTLTQARTPAQPYTTVIAASAVQVPMALVIPVQRAVQTVVYVVQLQVCRWWWPR